MKKKKVGVIAGSVAAIAVCSSMIVGSTLALFTGEDKVNIAVTSGKLDVTASVNKVYSYPVTNLDTETLAVSYGEKVLLEDGLKNSDLDNMKPGDKVEVELALDASKTTIAFQYRVSLEKEGNSVLTDNLLVGIDGVYYSDYVSAWMPGDEMKKSVTVTIIMPAYLTQEGLKEDRNCNYTIKVEAIQGNASVSGEAKAKVAHLAHSQEELNKAVTEVGEDDTVVLMQKWTGVSISSQEEKKFTVKGCDVGTLTVNAPNSTIDYLVKNTEIIEAQAVAPKSLHIYGNVTKELNLKEGRVVLEAGAKVAKATVAPEEGKEAKLEIAAASEKAEAAVVSSLVTSDGAEIVNNGKIENNTVSGEAAFKQALALGGTVVLNSDITLEMGAQQYFELFKDVTIDLNNKELAVNKEYLQGVNTPVFLVRYGATLEIKNGSMNIDMGYEYNTAIVIDPEASVKVNKVNYKVIGSGLFPRGDSALVEVVESTIDSTFYGVGTNAGACEYYNVIINIINSTILTHSDATPVLVNVPCVLNVKGSTLQGERQALIVRGGTATVKDSILKNKVVSDTENLVNQYLDKNWGGGNNMPFAALVVGNRGTSAYQYATNCTVLNTTFEVTDGTNKVYVYGNAEEEIGVTLIHDLKSDFVTVGGGEVKQTIYVSNAEEAQAALNNALDNTTIILKEGNYGSLTLNHSLATTVVENKNRYHRTVNNLTIIGEEKVVVDGFKVSVGHMYGSADNKFPDPLDGHIIDSTNNSYYSYFNIKNLRLENLNLTKSIDFGADQSDMLQLDGLTIYNCHMVGTDRTVNSRSNKLLHFAGGENFARNIVVEKCSAKNAFQGVYTYGNRDIIVKDCTFTNLGHNAVAIQNGTKTVDGQKIAVNGGVVVITGNEVVNTGNATKDRAIRIGDFDGGSLEISNNIFIDSFDSDNEVIKASSIAESVEFKIEGNTSNGKDLVAISETVYKNAD